MPHLPPLPVPDLSSLPEVGLFTFQFNFADPAAVGGYAAEIERQGWGTLWVPEGFPNEVVSQASACLAATESLIVATGVANVFTRDGYSAAAAQRFLLRQSGGRFLLGIGVGHKPTADFRGVAYGSPLGTMKSYLDAVDKGWELLREDRLAPRVLAALRPKMLALSAARAGGAMTYLAPIAHTRFAREALGPDPLLVAHTRVVLLDDEAKARELGRKWVKPPLGIPTYAKILTEYGFTDEAVAEVADDVLDATTVFSTEALRARIDEHLEAGASQVAVEVIGEDLRGVPTDEWAAAAAAVIR